MLRPITSTATAVTIRHGDELQELVPRRELDHGTRPALGEGPLGDVDSERLGGDRVEVRAQRRADDCRQLHDEVARLRRWKGGKQ